MYLRGLHQCGAFWVKGNDLRESSKAIQGRAGQGHDLSTNKTPEIVIALDKGGEKENMDKIFA